MLLILFGLLGSGKNFVGEILRADYGFFFYDADTDIPPEMAEAIQHERIVPDAARDRFFVRVIEHLRELRQHEDRLTGAQALYREKHRQLIQTAFPDAQFILVESNPDLIARRLSHRQTGVVSIEYARKIAPLFEPPQVEHFRIDNTGDRETVKVQLDRILDTISTAEMKGH